MPSSSRDRIRLLIKVADAYYTHHLTQQQIADELSFSRSTVSRLLEQAVSAGIVQIKIGHPLEHVLRLESILASRFEGTAFSVAGNAATEEGLASVGRLAAERLIATLARGNRLGLSTGTSITATVEALEGSSRADLRVDVAQLIGSVRDENPLVTGAELCRRASLALGGVSLPLPAPLVARDADTAAMFRQNDTVSAALEGAAGVDVACVGVGRMVQPGARNDVLAGWVDRRLAAQLQARGAVCHVQGQFLGASGELVDHELNHRVVSLDVDGLRRIPHVIAVSCGAEKAPALLAAVRGRIADEFVLDYAAAAALAALASR